MKQFTFEYTSSTKLATDLGRVSDWAKSRDVNNIWIQVYVTEEQGECFLPIRDAIALCLPTAKYVVTHAGQAFSADEVCRSAALIVCNLFEDPTTRLDLKQYAFDEDNYEQTIDELIEYINANPWIKLISFNAGNNLDGARYMGRLAENIDPDIKMTGAAAITESLQVQPVLFSSDGNISATALVMTFIGGDNFHVRTDVIVGWKAIGKEFTVTRTEGPILHEIDGMPAFELYKKYLKLDPKPGLIVSQTIEFPLCFEADGELFLRCPFVLNEDGSMVMMFNDFYNGQKIRLSFASPDVILDSIAAKLNEVATFEPQVISVNSCLGRFFFWGDKLHNELTGFKKITSSSGFLTGGELLRKGDKIRIFNETMVTTSMREGDKTPDGSGVRSITRDDSDYSLTQRLAVFIDTVTSDLEEYTEIVHRMAITDGLTGLNNRREIERIIECVKNDNKAFSLIMMDADDFKMINDTYGHKEGDKVLCHLADSILKTIDETGLDIHAGRWGGDEFLLACVSEDADDALRFAQSLQERYHEIDAYPEIGRTLSIGIATSSADMSLEEIYQKVDERLYAAKANGKACIER